MKFHVPSWWRHQMETFWCYTRQYIMKSQFRCSVWMLFLKVVVCEWSALICLRYVFIDVLGWRWASPYSYRHKNTALGWDMMTSWNGNIFRVTGHLCGKFTGDRWIPHNGQWRGALMFLLICTWIKGCANNRQAGDLRRHRVHYDVIVMISFKMVDGMSKYLTTLHVFRWCSVWKVQTPVDGQDLVYWNN